MSTFFNKCDVAINGSGVFSFSASVNDSNALLPTPIIGKKGPIGYSISGPARATMSINYIPNPSREPNFGIASFVKSYTGGIISSNLIEIAGITGQGYLTDYSLSVPTNEPAKASVTYECFERIKGEIHETDNIDYREEDDLKIIHGWTTYLSSGDNGAGEISSVPISQIDYSINASWSPVYTLGSRAPYQVTLLGGTETFRIVLDESILPDFKGTGWKNYFFNNNGENTFVNFTDHKTSGESSFLTLGLSGFKITNSNIVANVDNKATCSITMVRRF